MRLARPTLLPLVPLPALIVGALALLASTGSSAADSADAGPASTGAGAVEIVSFVFEPAAVRVAAGTEVVWTNQDSAIHSVRDSGDLFEESPDLASGDTFSQTYDEPGTYPYVCGIHSGMRGEVVVTD